MDKRIVDLEKVKENKYVEDHLSNIGLDEETVKDYDEDLKDETSKILRGFFIKRQGISDQLDDWIRRKCKTMADMAIFLSIITEHLQNLIVPDSEYFSDLVFTFSEESDLEFEHWINVQSELEKFHLSSMATYVKEMRKTK